MNSGITIVCQFCLKAGDFEEFCKTPVNGTLPADTFQCPHCRRDWRLLPNPNRFEGRKLVEVGAVL